MVGNKLSHSRERLQVPARSNSNSAAMARYCGRGNRPTRNGCLGERPVVVREMAFICRGISRDRNYYCVGVQAVRLIDAQWRHWDLSRVYVPVAS